MSFKSNQRPLWKEAPGEPTDNVIGTPGDLFYSTDTDTLWIKAFGRNNTAGWRQLTLGGGGGGGGVSVCSDIPAALSAGGAGTAGVDTDAARCDHNHPVPVTAPSTATGTTNAAGASTNFVRADHVHRIEVEVLDEAVLVGARPRLNFTGAGVTVTDNPGGDRCDIDIPSNAIAGQTGFPYDGMLFYAEPANPTSYDGADPPTTLADLRSTFTTPATVSNVAVTDGRFEYNGTTSIVNFGVLPAALEDLFAGGGTFATWCRPDSDGEGNNGYLAETSDSTITEGWRIGVFDEAGGLLRFIISQSFTGTNGTWETDRDFAVGQWYHVVIEYNSDAVANNPIIWVDGVEYSVTAGNLIELSTPVGAAVTDAGNPLTIGNRPTLDRTWDGAIGAVFMWDHSFVEDEVDRARRMGFAENDPNVIGVDVDAGTAKDMLVRAGDARTAGGTAGNLEVSGGNLGVTGTTGDLEAHGGDAPNGGLGSVTGGTATLRGGDADGSAAAGGLTVVRGGDPLGNSTAGGDLAMRGGDGNTLAAGDVFMLAGRRIDAAAATPGGAIRISTTPQAAGPFSAGNAIQDSGDIDVDTETGTTAANSGNMSFDTGSGSVSSGDISITTGTLGDAGAVAGRHTGSISITTGDLGSFLSSTGIGSISITAGSATSTEDIDGGQIAITAGDGTGTGNGADITLTPGDAGGTGRDGDVICSAAAAIIFPEYTVAGVPAASSHDNGVVIISDEIGGRTLATSDGTNWRRVSDGNVISS